MTGDFPDDYKFVRVGGASGGRPPPVARVGIAWNEHADNRIDGFLDKWMADPRCWDIGAPRTYSKWDK